MSRSSCGIVVASTLIPATRVEVALLARPIGAAAPAAVSRSASSVKSASQRRTG